MFWTILSIILSIIIIILACEINSLLKTKKTKEVRYVEKDIDAQKMAELESKFRAKENEMSSQIEKKWEESMESMERLQQKEKIFTQQLVVKKEKLIKDMDNEIELRKTQNDLKKKQLEEWIQQKQELADIQIKEIENCIENWRSKQNAIIESNKKLEELKNADSHYRISLSDNEKEELIELNKAIKKLRNPLPFYKAVYSVYYQPKINNLVLRVVGKGRVSGIYKITHIESGKTYVGQSVDIGNRWKQHAKRGCGADSITNNMLYPAMLKFGLEAFQFEIVETTQDISRLNEMEQYWQKYFGSKEFGFSIK